MELICLTVFMGRMGHTYVLWLRLCTICSVYTCWLACAKVGSRWSTLWSTRLPIPKLLYQTIVPPKGDMSKASGVGQLALSVDTTTMSSENKGPVRPIAYQSLAFSSNGSYNMGTQSTYQDLRYGFEGVRFPLPWVDNSVYSNRMHRNNTNITPLSNANGFASKNQNYRTNYHLVVRLNYFMFVFILSS